MTRLQFKQSPCPVGISLFGKCIDVLGPLNGLAINETEMNDSWNLEDRLCLFTLVKCTLIISPV